MYHHIKKLMYTVNAGTPDARFGNMLLEQFGGANGELAAAMQYSIQGLNCDDPDPKDLLMDIGTEELSHLEVVGNLARLHLKPMKQARNAAKPSSARSVLLDAMDWGFRGFFFGCGGGSRRERISSLGHAARGRRRRSRSRARDSSARTSEVVLWADSDGF